MLFALLGVYPPFSAVKKRFKAVKPPIDAEHAEKCGRKKDMILDLP